MSKAMTQIKFTIDSDIVSAFKARCADEGVSMTSAIRRFMLTSQPSKELKPKLSTRPLRKKVVTEIVSILNNAMELELAYRDNIPEPFAQRYEAADHTCNRLEEAIDSLEDAF
jgi:hypothetical protein